MEIRLATIDDVDAIALLFVEQFDIAADLHPYIMRIGGQSKQFIEETISKEESDIFVADMGGEIVGFSSIFEKETPNFEFMVPHSYAHLMDILVTKNHQGKGIATKLMEEAKWWATGRGLDYIELNVRPNNDSAINFYIKNGFEESMKTMMSKL